MREISLYLHIPFCERKCTYCVFASFVASEAEKERYISALCDELEQRKTDALVKSVYFGGGTPSVLNEVQFAKIFDCVRKNYCLKPDAEITVEGNPNSITAEKLECWKSFGVNRVSIGVQSLNDQILAKIGRLHTAEQALSCLNLAKKIVGNVSCDLLIGFEDDLTESAQRLIDAGTEHVSCYLLEVYKEAKIAKMIESGQIFVQSDERMMETFEHLCEFLKKKGFERYEISNFAKSGKESLHNLNYWSRGEYLGFGISAHSFVENKRIFNSSNFEDYYKNITNHEILSEKEENEEKIMLGLRCRLGVNKNDLKNYDVTKNPFYAEYLISGILTEKGDKFFLNEKFYGVSNTIISNLFEK